MKYLIIIFAFLLSLIVLPEAFAAQNLAPGSNAHRPFGDVKSIHEICGSNRMSLDPGQDLKFVSIAVPCFEGLISSVAESSIEGFSGFLADAVSAALVLYLIFFGVKVSTGLTNEQRLKGEVVIHALKIAFVTWLVFLSGTYSIFELTMQIFHGFIKLVMAPVTIGDCRVTAAETRQIWEGMDCIFGEFIGWNAPNAYGEGYKNIPLLFGLVTNAVSAGFGGIMIAGIILMTLWSLLMAFFRVAFAYVLSILAIVLLFTIAPITIPLMLFAPTKAYFEQWWKMIVSFVIQPVVMFAFMAFIFTIMNEIIMGNDGLIKSFGHASPAYENMHSQTKGDMTSIQQVFTMGINDPTAEKDMMLSLISMLIVAWLLLSFSKFVSSMGHELAGLPLTPNVGTMGPKWMQ